MSTHEHLQQSFVSGTLSKRLRGLVGSPLYATGLARCSNWEITPQGSLSRRPGSIFVKDTGNDPRCRLIPFPQSDGQDYLLLLSDRALRLFSLSSGLPFQAGASGLSFLVNGDFTSVGPGGAPSSWTIVPDPPASVTAANGDCKMYARSDKKFTNGSTWLATMHQTFTAPSTVAATLRVAYKGVEGEIDHLTIQVFEGASLKKTLTIHPHAGEVTEVSVDLVAGSQYKILLRLLPHESTSNDTTATVVLDYVTLAAASGGSGPSYEIDAPWTADQLAAVRYAAEPGRNRVYFVHPNVAPWFLARDPVTGAWTWQACSFTHADLSGNIVAGPPAEWADTNWPAVVEVYQSRLWMGGTPNEGNTIWASRSLDPFSFSTHQDRNGSDNTIASDSIVAPIATKGRIRWMHGRNMLLVGTDVGEYSLTAQGGAVTPMDMQVREESAFGSSAAQAIDIGAQVLYVSRDSRKIRGINFSQEKQGWQSRDITFRAEHLTEPRIREVHFARDPNGTIAVLLEDGSFAFCTYNHEEQVAGWWTGDLGGAPGAQIAVSPWSGAGLDYLPGDVVSYSDAFYRCLSAHTSSGASSPAATPDYWVEITDPTLSVSIGGVVSAAVVNGPLGSVLYGAVMRATGLLLEMIPWSESHLGRCYCDSASTVDISDVTLTNGQASVSGFDHLEGETVEVILDGALEGQQVVSGGGVLISRTGRTLTVGLPFTAEAETLPPAPETRAGVAMRSKRTWNKLYLRLNESALPLVRGDRLAPDRSPETALGSPEPLFTGDFGGPVDADWESRGVVTIVSDLPLRTEILALFGAMEEGSL